MTEVVITGAGIVSPLGNSVPAFLQGLHDGRVAVQASPWNDPERGISFWYSVVQDFEPLDWMDEKVAAGTDLFAQWTIAAAQQAVDQAGMTPDPRRTAIVHGTSIGGARALLKAQRDYEADGARAIDRKLLIQIWPNMAASQLAMRWHLHGPQLTITTACASSVDAIGTAVRLIKEGRADVALAGGTEGGYALADGTADGGFVPALLLGQISYGMMTGADDRLRASRPFDRDRAGIVTGEGAAMLVLESEAHARARGARILARVVGYGSLSDASHPSSPDPSGRWEACAMTDALADAQLSPERVDALVAHGTGTPKGDAAEILALNTVFGDRSEPLPVTSLKGHLGHTGASSGAMAAVVAIHAFETGEFPHTAGTENVDPAVRFRVVTGAPTTIDASVVQINSFGFGGQNASMVVQKVDR